MRPSIRIAGPTERPRLLIVGAFPQSSAKIFGGVITSCRLLLESSLQERVELVLVDSTQISNPPPGLFVRAIRAAARTLRFMRTFERSRPDAVLLFASAGASIVEKGFMAWYSRFRGVPALLFPRGGSLMENAESWLFRAWMRLVLGGTSLLLCQGAAWQRFAIGALGFKTELCPIIPNWTATPRLLELGRARVYGRGPNTELLFVGWVEVNKGVIELLSAFKAIAAARDVRLHIVGDGHAMPFVRSFVQVNGLEGSVQFSGWLDAEGIQLAYRQADVLVLPSWAEGLPNAMIEAMAAGLAVVVTTVGNIPDVVSDRAQALLVPSRNVGALTDALSEVVDDPALRESLGRAGHELANREFGAETAVARILHAMELARMQAGSGCSRMGS